jgi:hypothetical protein
MRYESAAASRNLVLQTRVARLAQGSFHGEVDLEFWFGRGPHLVHRDTRG